MKDVSRDIYEHYYRCPVTGHAHTSMSPCFLAGIVSRKVLDKVQSKLGGIIDGLTMNGGSGVISEAIGWFNDIDGIR